MATKDGGIHATRLEFGSPGHVNIKVIFSRLSAVAKVAAGIGGVVAGASHGLLPLQVTGWASIAAALPDLVASLVTSAETDPGKLAFVLVDRALACSIAELVAESRPQMSEFEPGEDFDRKLDEETGREWNLAPDFLEYPSRIEFLPRVGELLKEWFVTAGLPEPDAIQVSERLPTYFGLNLHEELTKHAEFFGPLTALLKSGTRWLAQEVWVWQRYRAQLIREPDRPIFDEPFGLRAVFVPLRAKWIEKPSRQPGSSTAGLTGVPVFGADPTAKATEHEVSIEEELDEWFNSGDRRDTLRVLSGDPGSGKSSCARMWAAKMAEAHPGWRVIFVPLHRFDYEDRIGAGLRDFLKAEADIEADLFDSHDGEDVLLFFDGLDELAMQGKTAREAAVSFVRQVDRELSEQNRDKRRVLVVLGGRQLVIQDCAQELKEPRQILHLEPYSKQERDDWWKRYGSATRKGFVCLPEELGREDLDELTAQPLLNYLLALSFVGKRLDFDQSVTINIVYADLLAGIYQKRWGPGPNVHLGGARETVSEDEFALLMEEVGVAVWHGDDSRSATLEAIRARCELSGLGEILAKLENDTDAGVFRLLTAFHVRFQGARGGSVEFSHKSFGEYFAARRIVRLMKELVEARTENEKRVPGRLTGRGLDRRQALIEWVKFCGPERLDATDTNLFWLLRREVASKGADTLKTWATVFADLVEEMLLVGMPMEDCGLNPPTYRSMDLQAGNAEEALLCALYACASVLDLPSATHNSTEGKNSEPTFYAAPFLDRCAMRCYPGDWVLAFAGVSALNYLKHLGVSHQVNLSLTGANLRGADLTRADLTGANLTLANLTRADLTRADLTRADLRGAYLTRADLTGANLTRADLTLAYLTGADLTRANLRGADLPRADLTRADLTGAYLTRANLRGANLRGANLRGADLTEADLTGADLTDALNWEHAIRLDLTNVDPDKRPRSTPVNDIDLLEEEEDDRKGDDEPRSTSFNQ